MSQNLDWRWRETFYRIVQHHGRAEPLREASLRGHLGDWTKALTDVVLTTCEAMDWQAAAKGCPLELLPIARHEYLSLDVVAFVPGEARWQFPVALMELENSRDDDRIAYSLWKVLCVRADLRIVYCYRRRAEQGAALVRFLQAEVVGTLDVQERTQLQGQTVVVVGSHDDATTFPYGFFRWWSLDTNTGLFRPM